MSDDDYDDGIIDSGPFCVHYGDPCDCEEKCARCGHTCASHSGGREICYLDECDCEAFVDED